MSQKQLDMAKIVSPAAVTCIIDETVKTDCLIVGFPSPGLAGTIAAKHIIDQLQMKTIGYIRSPVIPPVAVFFDGILNYPYRMHGCGTTKLAVLIGEAPVPTQGYYYLAKAALEWAQKTAKIKEVICLGGFPTETRTEKPKVFIVAEPDLKKDLEKFGLETLKQGYISDFIGAILNETILNPNLDGYALFVESLPKRPDPLGAIELINELNRIKGLNIDVGPLHEEEAKLQTLLEDFAQKTQELSIEDGTMKYPVDRSLYL